MARYDLDVFLTYATTPSSMLYSMRIYAETKESERSLRQLLWAKDTPTAILAQREEMKNDSVEDRRFEG